MWVFLCTVLRFDIFPWLACWTFMQSMFSRNSVHDPCVSYPWLAAGLEVWRLIHHGPFWMFLGNPNCGGMIWIAITSIGFLVHLVWIESFYCPSALLDLVWLRNSLYCRLSTGDRACTVHMRTLLWHVHRRLGSEYIVVMLQALWALPSSCQNPQHSAVELESLELIRAKTGNWRWIVSMY